MTRRILALCLLLPVTVHAQPLTDQMFGPIDRGTTIAPSMLATEITIGDVMVIDLKNRTITTKPGVKVDAAAQQFQKQVGQFGSACDSRLFCSRGSSYLSLVKGTEGDGKQYGSENSITNGSDRCSASPYQAPFFVIFAVFIICFAMAICGVVRICRYRFRYSTWMMDEIPSEVFDKFEVIDEREADWPKIHWYKLTANEVLEERAVLDKWIPIVRVVGDEVDLEGKPVWWGIVRQAKGAQQAVNYWTTAFTEAVALAPKSPWIIAEGQDEGYEQEFKNANTKPMAVIRYKPVDLNGTPMPPPQRVPMGEVPAGIRFDATVKDRVYDESGRALRELGIIFAAAASSLLTGLILTHLLLRPFSTACLFVLPHGIWFGV